MQSRGQLTQPGIGIFIVSIIAAVTLCTVIAGASAAETGTAEAQIAISEIRIDPEIFMQDDTGTLKVTITNSGSQSVSIDRVELLSDSLRVLNYQTYDKVGVLGAGNSLEFTFMLDARVEDGTYFPIFYVDFSNAGSMRYPIPIRVDDATVMVSIVKAPPSFSPGEKEEIILSLGNSRDNDVTSVTVVPGGEGIRSTQSAIFVGTLKPDEEKKVTIEITAEQPTELLFDVSWRNGPNVHYTTLALPVKMGDRKVAAELVVNSIEVTSGAGYTTIKGDVTNAGLKDAKSVTVTITSPARPVDPNPVYVIGALEPDDFSSFEVTCTVQGNSTIPLVIEYRDEDGNSFSETLDINLRNSAAVTEASVGTGGFQQAPGGGNPRAGGFGTFGSGISKVPVMEISLIIIGCLAGIFAWRKGYLNRIRDRFRK